MNALARRIRQLEVRYASSARRPKVAEGPSACELLAGRLAKMGVVPQGNESLAETTARALGWTMPELQAYLRARADGVEHPRDRKIDNFKK